MSSLPPALRKVAKGQLEYLRRCLPFPSRRLALRPNPFPQGAFGSTKMSSYTQLSDAMLTWDASEGPCVGSQSDDMVVPVDKQKPVDASEFNAISLEEVEAERTETQCLKDLGTSSDGSSHMVVDLNLKVEVVGVLGFGLGDFVEEVMEEEEVVIQMLEGEGLRLRGHCFRHYYKVILGLNLRQPNCPNSSINNQLSKMDGFFFLLACWCFLFRYCSSNLRSLASKIFWLGFHPFLRCKTIKPFSSMLYAIFDSELQPQFLQSLTFSSQILYFFQQRQHSQIKRRMLAIFLPSSDKSLMPICTATFCRAKSALTSQMLNAAYSYWSSLKEEVISAIFFSQFFDVIHPSSSSDSLEDEDTFLLGFAGTEIHSSSYYLATYLLPYYYCFTYSPLSSAFLVLQSSTLSLIGYNLVYYYSDSSSYQEEESSASLANSWRSSFSVMGGGSFRSKLLSPYCLYT